MGCYWQLHVSTLRWPSSGCPLAAGTLRAPSDTEQTATQKAGLSGLRVQGAVIDNRGEEDTTVLQLRTAKLKLFWAASRNPKKHGLVHTCNIEILCCYYYCSKLCFVSLDSGLLVIDSAVGLYEYLVSFCVVTTLCSICNVVLCVSVWRFLVESGIVVLGKMRIRIIRNNIQ